MTEPTLEMFLAPSSAKGIGKWQKFVAELEPNTPREMIGVKSVSGGYTVPVRKAAKAMGRDVRLRTFEGKVWACWVVDA